MTTKQSRLIALRTGEVPAEHSGEYWSKADIQLLERSIVRMVSIYLISLCSLGVPRGRCVSSLLKWASYPLKINIAAGKRKSQSPNVIARSVG